MDKSIGIDNSKTMYPCGKCKSTKVSNYEKQTRSGDEPMTQFFECADCDIGGASEDEGGGTRIL